MKKTTISIVWILLCFFVKTSFGQEIRFDFSDIKTINSENQAKRFCFENGFKFIFEDEYDYYYAFGHTKTSTESGIAEAWFIISKPRDGSYKDDWQVSLGHWYDGSSDPTFENIVNQVKSECTFFDFINYFGDEYICYSCPKSTYSGKIGFFLGEESDVIMHFNPKWFE